MYFPKIVPRSPRHASTPSIKHYWFSFASRYICIIKRKGISIAGFGISTFNMSIDLTGRPKRQEISLYFRVAMYLHSLPKASYPYWTQDAKNQQQNVQ